MNKHGRFWGHVRALANLTREGGKEAGFLDALVADCPSLSPEEGQALREQLQVMLGTLGPILGAANPDSDANRGDAAAAARRKTPYT